MSERKKAKSSRSALQRLLFFLVILICFMIYAYGWTVTDVDLAKPQEELRQANVGNALRELLSPRIFEQDREVVEIRTPFLMNCDADVEIPEPSPNELGALVSIIPNCGSEGDIIEIDVSNFQPLTDARIRWIPPQGESRPRKDLITGRDEIVMDNQGNFVGQLEVPRIRDSEGQIHYIAMRAAVPIGPVRFSDISQQTFLRMIETIFMALLATSLAIPVAALISFFAARNLMTPIHLSMGNLLIALLFLAIGWIIANPLLGRFANLAIQLGSGESIPTLIAFPIFIIVIVVAVYLMRLLNRGVVNQEKTLSASKAGVDYIRIFSNVILLTLLVIFIVGALSGFMILLDVFLTNLGESIRPPFLAPLKLSSEQFYPLNPAEWIQNAVADGLVAVGGLLGIIGTIIQLMMSVIVSLVVGVSLARIAINLLSGPVRNLPVLLSHIVGALLGAMVAGILFAVLGMLGMIASLFGLLSPIAAGFLGGAVCVAIYQRIFPATTVIERNMRSRKTVQNLLFWLGAALAFVLTFNILSVGRALIDGILPPANIVHFLGFEVYAYALNSALIGLILGGLGGAILGVKSNFPVGSTVYNLSRAILNTIRSIEPIIMGLVFVVWVGIGPFAGVLALTLHSIASLGKLYSEQVENIDEGPVEAIKSTGAGWIQTVVYAVVPQVIPPYIAFTMYRWDINVRMSTIIGFVGGGGIGLLLQQQINLLRYRDAGVAVLAIAVVVSLLDYASAYLRERLT